jgi:hypothetical protein
MLFDAVSVQWDLIRVSKQGHVTFPVTKEDTCEGKTPNSEAAFQESIVDDTFQKATLSKLLCCLLLKKSIVDDAFQKVGHFVKAVLLFNIPEGHFVKAVLLFLWKGRLILSCASSSRIDC